MTQLDNQRGGGGYMSPWEAANQRHMFDAAYGLGQFAPTTHAIWNSLAGNMLGGINTMNNLGNQIGQAYDYSNALTSGNMRARYEPEFQYRAAVDTNRTQERMQNRALQSKEGTFNNILPHIIAALGGQGAGVGGFQTNYGAGAQLGSQAQRTDTQRFKHPLLAMLGG